MAIAEGVYYIGTSNRVLTGSIDPDGTTTVTGVGTAFLSELGVGADILVSGETRTIDGITSDTVASVSVAFSDNANDTSPEVVPAYATVTAFEADIDTALTGNLTGKHLDEETTISTLITFDTDTSTHLLKLTADSGTEHNGGAYGNGARVAFTTGDQFMLNETIDGELGDVEVSKLALDITGNNNTGVTAFDFSGNITINRLLMAGSSITARGISTGAIIVPAGKTVTFSNNIIYGIGNAAGDTGIYFNYTVSGSGTLNIYNNTVIGCYEGITQDRSASLDFTLNTKNNLVQDSGAGGDFRDDGTGFGTTSKNISEDTTSPDASYRSIDKTTGDVFQDFANDDFRIAREDTNLDDGDDLSVTFTDDIRGTTRSPWYIGAHEWGELSPADHGIYSIGAAADYATVTAFEADIAAVLTGSLTGEHLNEETTISTLITFDIDTAGHLLKLTTASGAEHNGTFGSDTWTSGDGARVTMGTSDRLFFDETVAGDLADVEVSRLVLDIQGTDNWGLGFAACGLSGLITVNRMLIRGDTTSFVGINIGVDCINSITTNCIIYEIGNTGAESGIRYVNVQIGKTHECYNNTCVKNYSNFVSDSPSQTGTFTFKNNLAQGGVSEDYRDDGGGYGTSSKNISEDATSPDASYQSTDVHTNSVFRDYVNDDYRLDSAGDATNLAIVDDGDDLSGTFTDDIIGTTRSTWYIGAHELVVVAAAGVLQYTYRKYIRNLLTR